MVININFIKILAISLLVMILSWIISCDTNEPTNSAPEITNLTSNPATSSSNRLPYGQSITFQVTAVDKDKDPLSYLWECVAGSFLEGQGTNSVIWQSPNYSYESSNEISVTVSDGAETTKKSIIAYVSAPNPGVNVFPTSLNFGFLEDTLAIKVFNGGTGSLSWQIQNLPTWLSSDLLSGTLSQTTDTAFIKVITDRNLLNPGHYNNLFVISNSSSPSDFVNVDVSIDIDISTFLEGFTYYSGTTIPVSGVTVKIDNKTYTTISDGYYRLDNLTSGTKIIYATKDGYDNFSQPIEIVSGSNSFNVEMTSALFTFNVYGYVTSQTTNQPLQGVQVVILNPDSTESNLTTNTDFSGYYQVPTVPQGQRTIRFKSYNHNTFSETIQITNSNYPFNVVLNPKHYQVQGIIDRDTTFRKYNSPYYIVGNTSVLSGKKLTIEAGTDILFTGQFRLKGRIIAIGELNQPIKFTSSDTLSKQLWNCLEPLENSIFNYLNISYCDSGIFLKRPSINSIMTISNVDFYKNNTCILVSWSNFIVDQCNFLYNNIGIEFIGYPSSYLSRILNSNFINNEYAIGKMGHSYSIRLIDNSKFLSNYYATKCTHEMISNCIFRNNETVWDYPPDTLYNNIISQNNLVGLSISYEHLVTHCNIDSNYSSINLSHAKIEFCNIRQNGGNNYNNIYISLGSDYYTISNCNITNTTPTYLIYVANNANGDQLAENNWWGTDPPDPSKIHNTDYDPWLATPVPNAGPTWLRY